MKPTSGFDWNCRRNNYRDLATIAYFTTGQQKRGDGLGGFMDVFCGADVIVGDTSELGHAEFMGSFSFENCIRKYENGAKAMLSGFKNVPKNEFIRFVHREALDDKTAHFLENLADDAEQKSSGKMDTNIILEGIMQRLRNPNPFDKCVFHGLQNLIAKCNLPGGKQK